MESMTTEGEISFVINKLLQTVVTNNTRVTKINIFDRYFLPKSTEMGRWAKRKEKLPWTCISYL